jgi:hypothetical protein
MSRPPIPTVLDGALSAEQEAAIWQAVMGQPFAIAQPLTGWLLQSMSIWTGKRALSTQLASAFGISHKTWEAGLPKRPEKFRRAMKSMDSHIEAAVGQSTPECAARRERALKRALQSLSEDSTVLPCVFFHQTLGIAGGDALEKIAVRIDEISSAILKHRVRQDESPSLIVDTAVQMGEVAAGSVAVDSNLDPGLDATLMLMARLDRDLTAIILREDGKISSLFGFLVDMSHPDSGRNARHRLLDLYYALAIMTSGRSLPEKAPSIRELEEALLGGPPVSGGQSLIVRWRTKGKRLLLDNVETISTHIANTASVDVDHIFRLLWLIAQFWETIELGGPQAVLRAGERYRTWWNAMNSPGRKDSDPSHQYWRIFQPHA